MGNEEMQARASSAKNGALPLPKAPTAPGLQHPMAYYFVSELLGTGVRYEDEERPFGRLEDIGARHAQISYPLAASLEVVAGRRGIVLVAWSDVASLSSRQIVVRKGAAEVPKADFWLRRDVLDDQVVDISGAKVRRVNDIHVLHAEGQLIIAHVDIGLRGILRRIGIERPACALVRWLSDYTIKESFVSWRNLEMLNPNVFSGELRVSAPPSQLAEIHPAELADILESLGLQDRQALFKKLSAETAAEALQEVDPGMQRALISEQVPEKAADILQEMRAKDAAAVLRDMHETEAEDIMSRMESGAAEDVQTLLAHEEETAGGAMETSCLEARPGQRAGEVLEGVRAVAKEAGVFNYVYVLDGRRHLLGVLNLRELFSAPPDVPIESLMTAHIVKVRPDTRLRDVGRAFAKYGFRAIPVVTEDNVFIGAVRLTHVLDEIWPMFRE